MISKSHQSSVITLFLAAQLLAAQSHAQTMKPHKDELFTNASRKVLETRDNGAVKRYHWDEMEDVNGRDSIPGQEAKPERVDLSVLQQQRNLRVKYAGGELDTYEVGASSNADFAVIYIHGAGGTKELGAKDLSFGGNFNRLKNLAAKNNGAYYSPTVTFDDSGDRGVLALIDHIKKNSPKAKIAIACGSAGAHTCWSMADKAGSKLSGIIITGGARSHQNIENSAAYVAEVPIHISHGTNDRLVPWQMYQTQYSAVRKNKPSYPVRLELFEGGKHGTPMRNIDWKEVLEWSFAKSKSTVPVSTVPSKSLKTRQ